MTLIFSLIFQAPHEQDLKVWGVWSRGKSPVYWKPWVGIPVQLAVWPWVSQFPSLSLIFFICKMRSITSIGKVTRIQCDDNGRKRIDQVEVCFVLFLVFSLVDD